MYDLPKIFIPNFILMNITIFSYSKSHHEFGSGSKKDAETSSTRQLRKDDEIFPAQGSKHSITIRFHSSPRSDEYQDCFVI